MYKNITISIVTFLSSLSLSETTFAKESNSNIAKFYCDRQDNNSSRPATWMQSKANSSGRIPIIVWSDLGDLKAIDRCQSVSKRLQTAWEQGNLNYLGSSEDTNGAGIICARKERGQSCDGQNLLFTLQSGQKSKETISRLQEILKKQNIGPIYQSSGEYPEVDMQDVIKALQASQQ